MGFFFKKEGLLSEEEEMQVLIKNDNIMEQAHKSYKKFTASDKMLEIYEAREKRLRDEASNIAYAREQGIEQGEHKKAVKTAKKMLSDGMSSETVAMYTGLSEEEIEKLK